MNKDDLAKAIFDVIGETQSKIKEAKADKNLVDPIEADVVKTLKAMGYELIMEKCLIYKKRGE